MGFRVFAIALALLAASTAGAATERLKVVPVSLLGYKGDKLEISVELPCGAEYLGLVTSQKKKEKLTVAALVKKGDFMCASMPERKRMLVDFLATRDFKTISPMEVSKFKGRFVMVPIRDLRLFKKKNTDERVLQGAYETRCGYHVGTVIQRESAKKVNVGFIEHLVRGARTTDCPTQQKVRRIKAVHLTGGMKVATLRKNAKNKSKSLKLRIAKIDPNSFRRLEAGGLRFQYLRRCNEAPVGIVVGKRTIAKQAGGAPKRKATFGMLVARYEGLSCRADETTEAWTRFTTKDVSLPRGWIARLMVPSATHDALTVKSPREFAKLSKAKRKGLYVDYIKGCDLTLGTVYARNSWVNNSVLSVGVLSRKGGRTCAKSIKEVSLYQPFVSKKVPVTDMFPLKIRGMAH